MRPVTVSCSPEAAPLQERARRLRDLAETEAFIAAHRQDLVAVIVRHGGDKPERFTMA